MLFGELYQRVLGVITQREAVLCVRDSEATRYSFGIYFT